MVHGQGPEGVVHGALPRAVRVPCLPLASGRALDEQRLVRFLGLPGSCAWLLIAPPALMIMAKRLGGCMAEGPGIRLAVAVVISNGAILVSNSDGVTASHDHSDPLGQLADIFSTPGS